jgi:hypothetical protein
MVETKLDYKTYLVWNKDKTELIPFYKYNHKIGFIPAGIDFTYRKKNYNTMNMMSLFANIYYRKSAEDMNFKVSDWYCEDYAVFNKKLFMKILYPK